MSCAVHVKDRSHYATPIEEWWPTLRLKKNYGEAEDGIPSKQVRCTPIQSQATARVESRYWRMRIGCSAWRDGYNPQIGKVQFCARPTPVIPPLAPPPPPSPPPLYFPPPSPPFAVCYGEIEVGVYFQTPSTSPPTSDLDLETAKVSCAESYRRSTNKRCVALTRMTRDGPWVGMRDRRKFIAIPSLRPNSNAIDASTDISGIASVRVVPCTAPSPPPVPPGVSAPPMPTCAWELVYRQTAGRRADGR